MYPDLITIGNFTLTSFGVMMFLAFLTAALVARPQYARRGLDPDLAWDLLLWVVIGGLGGAKLYYLFLHWDAVLVNPIGEIFNRSGFVWYGGLIGGVAAYYWQIRRRKLPMAAMFDATAPGLALAYVVGRLGCFLVGDDYGVPTESWVGIAFPNGMPPTTAANLRGMGVDVPADVADWTVLAVHPTQLYEMGAALILFALLWRLSSRSLPTGQLFAVYLGLYGMLRFVVEFVRANPDQLVFGFSTSQAASLLLILLGAYLYWHRGQVGEPTPVPASSAPRRSRSRSHR